jgi:SAM-dependent methyltransferase
MKIFRIRNLGEYQSHLTKTHDERMHRRVHEKLLLEAHQNPSLKDPPETLTAGGLSSPGFTVPGYSYTAGKDVDFFVSLKVNPPNWRETLKCPQTNLINRVRGGVHVMDIECAPYADDTIYIMEKKTSTYQFLKQRYPGIVGSEYLGDDVAPGQLVNGVRHENATQLTFEDNSLDHILSFDVFEHVPSYLLAFKECYRTLREGGTLMWSVPMARKKHENIVRATLNDDGTVNHLLEPEYHGDSVKREGILCFYHFGWEMLSQVRDLGFSDVYATLYSSREFAYLGDEGLLFIARK